MRESRGTDAFSNSVFRPTFSIGSTDLELTSVHLGRRTSASSYGIAFASGITLALKSTDKIDTSSIGSARVGRTFINILDTFTTGIADESRRTSTKSVVVKNTTLGIGSTSSRIGTRIFASAFVTPLVA